MKHTILQHLPVDHPWQKQILWFDTIDSTNTQAKKLAAQGAPHGTVLIAGQQSAGKGRMGRSFVSSPGMGVYMSVILRPSCPPVQLMHLTCAAAVAMCEAVENCSGIRPGIKWINDLVVRKHKLGGILTELVLDPATGLVDAAIIGVGINTNQQSADFPAELQDMATSLFIETGKHIDAAVLAAAMIEAFIHLDLSEAAKAGIMAVYRRDCITLGQNIRLVRGNETSEGVALDVDDQGALIVRFSDGSVRSVNSGEASVRGMYGYL